MTLHSFSLLVDVLNPRFSSAEVDASVLLAFCNKVFSLPSKTRIIESEAIRVLRETDEEIRVVLRLC